jgi:Na+/H+-dicarboxylate symporter
MLQIIFFALILGVILAQLGDRVSTVRRFFSQFNEVMMSMVTLVLRVAPIGVFCLISRTFAHLGLDAIVPMLKFVGGTYLGLAFQLCVVYMVLLRVFARLNPFRFLKKMLPVMGFAFSTSSSNATIPLNINTLEKKVGVNPKIASFTIPLGATINMDGTAIMQGVAVVFVAQAFGIPLGPMEYMTVILTATLASIGTAGVPGVGTIMLAMVFDAVGLPAEGISMIMGVDRIVDMGRTAINVTGDAVVTAIVARANKALNTDVFNDIVTDQNVEAQEEQRTALEQGDLDALSDNETTVSDKDEN